MSVLGRTYMPADKRRAQILECARAIFARHGFHVTSIADICKAAGIGRGTLYQYFSNKRDVFYAVVEDLTDRVRKVLSQRTPITAIEGASEAPAAMVVSFCERRLRTILDAIFFDEAALRLILREARGLDGGIEALIQKIDSIVLDAMVSDLTAAQQMGVIDCPDPKLTALYYLGGIEKMVLAVLDSGDPIDLDHIVSIATRLELFGLLSNKTRHHTVAMKEESR